jgi:hypothetical protein
MNVFVKTFRWAAAVGAVVFSLTAIPASAGPITYIFNGTLEDGASASGAISLNILDYLAVPTSITSTDGLFIGHTYALPNDPSNFNYPTDTIVVLSAGPPAYYSRYLYLVFDHSLADGTPDALLAAQSFECDAYGNTDFSCTGNCDHIRYFTSVTATPAPEPATLALFGTGLLTFATRRRKRA